ncbi:hypothetical protein [uncultured Paracoccus sp.]|uniref:RcgA family putative transporter n=1 Tax=uncultured Paracoccus sp. TaxID=189685 RepID=UPI002637DC32|nr:hypothetical protein [uncultured Paracoccus sp.]
MLKNGKYFIAPPKDSGDFKEVFRFAAAAGAGRPVSKDGFADGPWTAELLAEAISRIDANRTGIDLRTIQLWFQANEKGISSANIRWLARVFGCDDPGATSEWQVELSAAQARLTTRRRERKGPTDSIPLPSPDIIRSVPADQETRPPDTSWSDTDPTRSAQRLSLATMSEAIFTRGSPLNLPATVFGGAVALGFLSYFLRVHNVTYTLATGDEKQVGFLWAPNWTFLFMVSLPLFFTFVINLLIYWKEEGRPTLVGPGNRTEGERTWERNVEASSYTFWVVLIICLLFAGILQWISVRLIPLVTGTGNYPMDWGLIAIVRPDLISSTEAIVFTGLAYLYMSICFYILFSGFILLYSIVDDFIFSSRMIDTNSGIRHQDNIQVAGMRIIIGIFRCAVLGIVVSICMKLQSAYLASNGTSISSWLVNDMISVLSGRQTAGVEVSYSVPTHYSSLVVVLASCVVFFFCAVRMTTFAEFQAPLRRMGVIIVVLVAGYLLIGAFPGFSIPLIAAAILAFFSLLSPGFPNGRPTKQRDNQSVS